MFLVCSDTSHYTGDELGLCLREPITCTRINGLTKVYPPDQIVLKNIELFFLPGVKIGRLGLNSSTKITLLLVKAGVVLDFDVEAFPADGITVWHLPQEPELNPSKSNRHRVHE